MFSIKSVASFARTYDVLFTKPKNNIFSNVITNQSDSPTSLVFKRWATKKSSGGSNNGRDSNPKYRGVKKYVGETVLPGNIIVRQKGSKFFPGENVGEGKDCTLTALKPGFVKFVYDAKLKRTYVHVYPIEKYLNNDENNFLKLCKDKREHGKIWPQFMNRMVVEQKS